MNNPKWKAWMELSSGLSDPQGKFFFENMLQYVWQIMQNIPKTTLHYMTITRPMIACRPIVKWSKSQRRMALPDQHTKTDLVDNYWSNTHHVTSSNGNSPSTTNFPYTVVEGVWLLLIYIWLKNEKENEAGIFMPEPRD